MVRMSMDIQLITGRDDRSVCEDNLPLIHLHVDFASNIDKMLHVRRDFGSVMIAFDEDFSPVQLGNDIERPCTAAYRHIAKVVHFVVRCNDTVPSLDHIPIHRFD